MDGVRRVLARIAIALLVPVIIIVMIPLALFSAVVIYSAFLAITVWQICYARSRKQAPAAAVQPPHFLTAQTPAANPTQKQ